MGEEGNQYVSVGEVVVGKYLVERLLGVGGMAFVVSARHIDLDEHFALKFLSREFLSDKNVVERFTREAKAACMIRSEHVARVMDVGVHEGAPFLVMEHLTGRDLCTVVNDGGALPIANAVEYVMQTCEALAVAHSLGIVHRDIKPENLFLVEHAGLPSIKLLDFGISKLVLTGGDKSSRLTGKLTLGTPCYMSPEQIRSTASADPRSDLWSLGVVLYSLLTGREAFQADSVTETCAAVLESDPVPLREIRPEIPEALAHVVMKCLAKDPEKRHANVAELAVALVPFAPSRALVSAERSSSTMKTPRFKLEGKVSSRPSLLKPSSVPPSSMDGVTKSASSMLQATPLSLSLDMPLFDPSELAGDVPEDAFGTKEDLARMARDAESRSPFKTRRSPKHRTRRGRSVFLGAATLIALGVAVFGAQRAFDRVRPAAQASHAPRPETVAVPTHAAATLPSVPVEDLPAAATLVKRPPAPPTVAGTIANPPPPQNRPRPKSEQPASAEPSATPPASPPPAPSASGAPKVELGY